MKNLFVSYEITKVNGSILHKIGNIIAGVCKILDGIIIILTLGCYNTDFSLNWAIKRRYTIFCSKKLKEQLNKK